jgi:hypothetical protein
MGNLAIGVQGSSYYDWAKKGRIYTALALVTAPVIYTTAAGTGGPLLWNNSAATGSGVNAVILAVSAALTTAASAASVLGITGNSGQASAPSSTTAIDAVACTYIGARSNTPSCNVYRVGTVSTAGNFFLPTHTLDTGAITTVSILPAWVDIGGLVVVPPGSWCSIAAAATATSAVCKIGIVWCEVPIL